MAAPVLPVLSNAGLAAGALGGAFGKCCGACPQCHYIIGGSSRGVWTRQCSFSMLPCNVLFKDQWVCLCWWPLFAPGPPLRCSPLIAKAAARVPHSHDKCPSRTELESSFGKNTVWCWLIYCPKTVLWLRFGSEPILGMQRPSWALEGTCLFVLSATQGGRILLQFTGACPWKLYQVCIFSRKEACKCR